MIGDIALATGNYAFAQRTQQLTTHAGSETTGTAV